MAFLDNSGDIILDAVLTDLGRKRMAEGNFRITQFALGDDEIDYSLYNKSHPSGSAYYDLEILQTPIFEAFTRENSNINYGLLTFDGNTDLFYLPKIVLNQKSNVATSIVKETSGIVYLAANQQTYDILVGAGGLGTNQVSKEGNTNQQFVFETGIDNSNDPAGTQQDRKSYLVDTGLLDNEFTLACDGRFLTSVSPIEPSSKFEYPPDSATITVNIQLQNRTLAPLAGGAGVTGQRIYILPSIANKVFDQGAGSNTAATTVSEINGPRGQVTAFNFGIAPDLKVGVTGATPSKFSLYGRTAVATSELPGIAGSQTYDIIDTIVYLNGNTTGANTQLIVRIIRQATS
jgi:hypothetical protein